jgi:DNA-binding transcriptional LysR family regulator
MDKFNAMHTFVRVAEAGSFIAVANQLNVDRSLVTRQISALEKQLGTKLITRSTRSLTLTTAGAAYLEKCRVILNMLDAAESSLAEEKAIPRGRIRLGLPLSFGLQRLMPALIDFGQQHPQIELAMDFSDRRANLIEEGIDLSIRITAELDPGDIVRKLGTCRLLTLASQNYLAQNGTPKQPEDLLNHECLTYASDMRSTSWQYTAQGQTQSIAIRGRFAANNGVALTQAAAAGLGITRQPDFIAQPFLERGEVVEILQNYRASELGIYAVLPSNRYIPHRVSVLINHVAQFLGSAPNA